ncbi:MAG: tyrosine-type recombinase/integrase [Candidatus Melainabacteria bacterium]|nr:tyrosine-type recombinase/integrase [Candidatus Melainabacteria bacterium]
MVEEKTGKKFTAKHIRALSCPDHLKQRYISVLPDVHLYVSVGRGGKKSFCFRLPVERTWRVLDLNCKFEDSLPDALLRDIMLEAQSRAAELTARLNRGENVFEKQRKDASHTLQELFDHYREHHLEKRGKRVLDNENNFKRWFAKKNLAKKKANEFSHEDAGRLHSSMQETPGSANRAVQLGRAMFNFGIKTHFISRTDNPFAGVSLYRENERDRVLSDEEAAKLLTALEAIPAVHNRERTLRDFILLSLLTGARKSNVMTMRWDEVDLKNGTWSIPAEKMKTQRAQVIPLGEFEKRVLAERKQLLEESEEVERDCPWVFPGKGAAGHMVDPGNAWESLRKDLGMSDLWIHDLRRSLASSMANTGADVSVVRAALHHTDTRTTLKAYIRTSQQVQLQARQKAQEAWFDAMKRQSVQSTDSNDKGQSSKNATASKSAKRKKKK